MDYPDVDKLFLQEINDHNTLIEYVSALQQSFAIVSRFGFDVNTFLHDVTKCIQRKDYETAVNMISDVVYSIDKVVSQLKELSDAVKLGVSKTYAQEGNGS